jgi:uncharacterized protein YuzE
MKGEDKQLYLYSGLAIAGGVLAYLIITSKKKKGSSKDVKDIDEDTTVGVSTTGEVLDVEQIKIPESLSKILSQTSAQATALLANKPVYTKIDNVKLRYDNYVNNGVFNNIMSEITNKGFLLGNVIQIVDDKGKLKNLDGRVYKWFKIKPAQITLDEMNRNRSFLTHFFLPTSTGRFIYVREDLVKLEK